MNINSIYKQIKFLYDKILTKLTQIHTYKNKSKTKIDWTWNVFSVWLFISEWMIECEKRQLITGTKRLFPNLYA